jgi:hypothetical protein
MAHSGIRVRDVSSNVVAWALAIGQLVSWGTIYYAFSLFVVPMEYAPGWSRTATNAALSAGLLVSGVAAYPVGVWIDRGRGRAVTVGGSLLASAMMAIWSQAQSLAMLFVAWAGLGMAMAATLYDPVFAVITRCYPNSLRTKITLITLVGGFKRHVQRSVILVTMAVIGPAQVLARILWFTVGRNVSPKIVGVAITTAFPVSVVILLFAGASPVWLILFALIYGGANGMMTILRGTIVQDVMWVEGYGAVNGLLATPSNIAKGIAPISAAAIWAMEHSYLPVEWVVMLVSLVSAVAFGVAMMYVHRRDTPMRAG